MKALLRRDPAAFAAQALPAAERDRLPQAVRDLVERRLQGRGFFGVYARCHKEHDHGPGGLGREVRIGGRTYRVHLAHPGWEELRTLRDTALDGIALEDELVLDQAPVAPLAPLAPLPVSADTPNKTGANTFLYIIAKFSDEGSYPQTEADALAKMLVTSDFYRNNSGNTVYFQGRVNTSQVVDVVFVTLPQPMSYGPTYNSNFSQILADGTAAAKAAGFDSANYNLFAVATSDQGFDYAGRAWMPGTGLHLVKNYFSLRTVGHELGHNFGLPHAYFWRTDATTPIGQDSVPGGYVGDTANAEDIEYGHYFSVMSAQYSGEMDDATKPHFTGCEKGRLGWVTGAAKTTISTSGTYRLHRHDHRNASLTPRAAVIGTPSTYYAGTGKYYWLDYRCAPWTTAGDWLQNGVLVNWNSLAGTIHPTQLDMTPFSKDATSGSNWDSDNNDKKDASITLGRTYSDRAAGIHITPVARGGTDPDQYIDVVVNLGTFTSNHAPTVTLAASATTTAVNTAVDFTASGSDADGDALAYSWDFDQVQVWTASGLNTATAQKAWGAVGQYRVTVTASDMKGGIATASTVITVGTPASTGQIWGRVLWGGRPVADARVWISALSRQTWTGSDGGYILCGLPVGSHTVACDRDGLTFTAKFTNPVPLGAAAVYGCDFWANEPLPDPNPMVPTRSVAGTVRDDGVGLAGVTVTAGGIAATTASNGTYTLNGLPDGAYTLVAAKTGYAFTPASRAITVAGANLTGQDFARTAFAISGVITGLAKTDPAPTISWGGPGVATAAVYNNGSKQWEYSIQVPAGTRTLTASSSGWVFTPSGWSNPLTVAGAQSGRDFAGVAGTAFTVRGTISEGGRGVGGVTVGDGTRSAVSDSDGNYVLVNVPNGTSTVTPDLAGYTFTPASLSVTVAGANLIRKDFTATGPDAAPTVATAAQASPTTVATPAGTCTLTVLGADDGGESALTYTWAATSAAFPVTFSANGSNAAKSTVISFTGAGAYTFRTVIADAGGRTATSSVSVTVNPDTSGGSEVVTVSPHQAILDTGAVQTFTAQRWSTTGSPLATSATWAASGGGNIDAAGVYTAATPGGSFAITATASGVQGGATVWVTTATPVTLSIAAQDATAAEPGRTEGNATFRITRSGSTANAIIFTYLISGTATNGDDYATLTGTGTVPAGQTTVDITVTPVNDSVAEVSETVILTLVAGSDYGVGTASATATIYDDETPAVSVAVTDATCTEASSDDGVFTLTRLGDLRSALTVNYTMTGTATNGTDYANLGGTVSLGANAATATVTVNPTDDTAFEPAETAILTVQTGTGYAPAAPTAATITIADNDKPQVSLSASDATATEAGDTATITVSINGTAISDLTVRYTVTGTATASADYPPLLGTVLIPTGAASATVTVTALADALVEAAETVTLTLATDAAYTVATAPANAATVTLVDDDEAPAVSIAATDTTASEPGRTEAGATFTVTRLGSATAALTVAYAVSGSATSGADFTALAGTVSLGAGERSALITVTPLDDGDAESDETVVVTLRAGTGYAVAHPASASITLYDDEPTAVSVALNDADCQEQASANTGRFRFTRVGNRSAALNIVYAVSGTAVNGTDYTAIASPIALGANNATVDLTITPTDDATTEGPETVVITVQTGTGYVVGTPADATLTIRDDETVDVTVAAQDGTAVEGSTDKGTFRITRSAASTSALTVNYALSGTATNGTDYASLPGTATIAANATTVDVSVDASLANDGNLEGEETVVMTIIGVAGQYEVGATPSATVLLRDDDVPTLTLAAGTAPTESGTVGTFTLTAAPAPAVPLVVAYTVSGNASPGADYVALSGSVTVGAGATSATITVTPLDDAIRDANETVTVTLNAAATYNRATTSGVNLTIADDDLPTVTVTAVDASAGEPADTGRFLITQSTWGTGNLTVNYAMSGTATATADYTGQAATATISAGSLQAVVTLTPVDDTLQEGAETAILTITANGSNYTIGTPASATVTVGDNDTGNRTVTATLKDEFDVVMASVILGPSVPLATFASLSGSLDNVFDFVAVGGLANQ